MKYMVSIVVLLAASTTGAKAPVDDFSRLTCLMVHHLHECRAELTALRAGKTGVNGFAVYGAKPPPSVLVGNDFDDQVFSSASRIRVLDKEIAFAQRTLLVVHAKSAGMDADAYAKHLEKMNATELAAESGHLKLLDKAPDAVFVLSAYHSQLKRHPDASDFVACIKKLTAGMSREKLINELNSTPGPVKVTKPKTPAYADRVTRYDGTTEEFVTSVYRCVFHREPGKNEVAQQVKQLNGKLSREIFMLKMFTLGEYPLRRTTDGDFSRDVYQAVMAREPLTAEKEQTVRFLSKKGTRAIVVSTLLASKEYAQVKTGKRP